MHNISMNKFKSQEGCKMLSCYDRIVKIRIVNQRDLVNRGIEVQSKVWEGGGNQLLGEELSP